MNAVVIAPQWIQGYSALSIVAKLEDLQQTCGRSSISVDDLKECSRRWSFREYKGLLPDFYIVSRSAAVFPFPPVFLPCCACSASVLLSYALKNIFWKTIDIWL